MQTWDVHFIDQSSDSLMTTRSHSGKAYQSHYIVGSNRCAVNDRQTHSHIKHDSHKSCEIRGGTNTGPGHIR